MNSVKDQPVIKEGNLRACSGLENKKVHKGKGIARGVKCYFNRSSKTKIGNRVLDLAMWRSLMNLTRSISLTIGTRNLIGISLRENIKV